MNSIRPRRLLLLLSVLLLIYGFYMGGLQYVISDISADFISGGDKQGTGIGILISIPHVFSLFFPILMGAISDKVGKKKILLSFVTVFTVGCGICAGAPGMLIYLIGVTMVGIGHSVCESVSTAVLADLNPEESARNINISQGFLSAGAVLGPVLVRWLMTATGANWRSLFVVSGTAFAVMFALLIVTKFPAQQSADKQQKKEKKMPVFGSVILLCFMAAMMLYIGIEKGIGNFTESYFTKDFHRKDLGAYAISLYWCGMTIARFILRLKPKKLNRTMRVHFLITAALFAGLSFCSVAYASLLLCFMIGFASAPIWSGLVALATRQFPEHSGAVSGIMSSSGSVGSTLSPLLMGVVSDSFGIRVGFLLMTAFSIGGAVLLLFTSKRK